LKNSKALCNHLIVGVTTDDLVEYKGKRALIPFIDRLNVVDSCRYVDQAIPQTKIDKFDAWQKLKFDVLFVGDDWFGDPNWKVMEEKLNAKSVKVIYFPYTSSISSTKLNKIIELERRD
jgi:glycerol-3-phosphate cytidylyltransferase